MHLPFFSIKGGGDYEIFLLKNQLINLCNEGAQRWRGKELVVPEVGGDFKDICSQGPILRIFGRLRVGGGGPYF